MAQKVKGKFIEPMLLLRSDKLPDGSDWLHEIKLDGYRAIAFKSGGKPQLRSRNDNDFTARYPSIAAALTKLPDETVIDCEVVALDEDGKASFNVLQNYGSSKAPLLYYVFDVIILSGKDVTGQTLDARRALLESRVLPLLAEPIRYSTALDADLPSLIKAVKDRGIKGLVAKRRSSRYEPGQRSGAWMKMRVNQGQELVIGGYTPSPKNFDALVIGYYDGPNLIYSARTRNGFTPALRSELFKKMRPLEIEECPFVNLPEKKAGRWGAGLTAAKMAECRWLTPQLIGQFEFVEWTPDNHLRHTKFVVLREDKNVKQVVRER